jgi:hypothetical protein
MKKYYLNLLLIICFISCNKDTTNEYQINDIRFFKINELFNYYNCFSLLNLDTNKGIVIKDSTTYKIFEDSIRIHPYNTNCDTPTLMKIDFNKYSLIGFLTNMSACDSLTKVLNVDNKNKLIKYKIDIKEYQGGCSKILLVPANLALINKIPDYYNVEFIIVRHK